MDLASLLSDYQSLPEYSEIKLESISSISLFGDRPIHIAATRGALDELTILVENGADINSPGEHGYTALHDAVEQGHQDAVLWLLRQGADKSLRTDTDLSPYDLAQLLGETEIALLVKDALPD